MIFFLCRAIFSIVSKRHGFFCPCLPLIQHQQTTKGNQRYAETVEILERGESYSTLIFEKRCRDSRRKLSCKNFKHPVSHGWCIHAEWVCEIVWMCIVWCSIWTCRCLSGESKTYCMRAMLFSAMFCGTSHDSSERNKPAGCLSNPRFKSFQ